LRGAGFDTPDAVRAARGVLATARLSNPRKQGIAAYKRQAALDVLAATFILVCGAACKELVLPGRVPVVSRTRCDVCGRSNNQRAILSAARALTTNGVRSVLIVGGSGEQHREIAAVFRRHGIKLQGVIGTSTSHSRKDADANMRRAGLMVVWGSTELRHALSNLYTSEPPAGLRVVKVNRRSTEALCQEIVRSFALRR
jgi:hypothetical protein